MASTLSAKFIHGLNLSLLYGVPLGFLGNMYHLQYIDDFIIFTDRGIEDLQIIKLVRYLYVGLLGLAINFKKNCLYTSKFGHLPGNGLAFILNCSRDMLPSPIWVS